jgi:predicted negative regulator of RcsB-dependent stress response
LGVCEQRITGNQAFLRSIVEFATALNPTENIMIDVYTTEAEQVEQLKKWWKEYGLAIIIGIVLALVLGFGWRSYQQHHEHKLEHASTKYEQLLTNVVNGNTAAVEAQAKHLMSRYPHTPYAELAALQLARQMVYQNDWQGAEIQLRWVMSHGDNSALRQVARMRIARLLLAQNNPQAALKLLQKVDDKAYIAQVDEIKGDILATLGEPQQAYQAYQLALKVFPGFQVMQPLLQMKIDNMAGTGVRGQESGVRN